MNLPDCSRRGEIRGHLCQCSSNRMLHMVPGMAPLSVCAICCYVNQPDRDDIAKPDFSCVHRGPELRTETCQICGSRHTQVTVFDCELHGQCTVRAAGLRFEGEKMAVCIACNHMQNLKSI